LDLIIGVHINFGEVFWRKLFGKEGDPIYFQNHFPHLKGVFKLRGPGGCWGLLFPIKKGKSFVGSLFFWGFSTERVFNF